MTHTRSASAPPADPLPGSCRAAATSAAAPSEARVSVPPEVRDRIDEAAWRSGLSRPEFVRDALERALAHHAARRCA